MIPSNEDLQKLVTDLRVQARDSALQHVVGIITEVYSGAHNRRTVLIPPLTVGDVRSIKGWWHARWIIQQMYSTWCGRVMRLGLHEAGIGPHNLNTPEVMGMLTQAMMDMSRPEDEKPILDEIISKTKVLFGDTPVDVVASKKVKLQLLSYMQHLGVPPEGYADDGKYD